MGFFDPQGKPRTQNVSFRCHKDLKESVRDLARLWTEIERARSGDPEAVVSETDVWIRLGEVASEVAWQEAGGRPKGDAEWKQTIKAQTEKYAAASAKR